jgi:RNA polymerase sigma factor (sigma-70 family)
MHPSSLQGPEASDAFDRVLLQRSEAHWREFLHLASPLLRRHAASCGCAAAEIDDAVQDVVVRLLLSLHRFEAHPELSVRAWLRAVASNVCRDRMRKWPTPTHPQALDALPGCDPLAEALRQNEHADLVHRAREIVARDFTATTGQIFWARLAEERPAAEIAAELGMNCEQVYDATRRVLARLREELPREDFGP